MLYSCLSVGYQKFVDPGVSPEFQAAAIRFGITMAPPGVYMRYYRERLKESDPHHIVFLFPFTTHRSYKVHTVACSVHTFGTLLFIIVMSLKLWPSCTNISRVCLCTSANLNVVILHVGHQKSGGCINVLASVIS